MQSLMFFDILQYMAAKVAEVFEALEVFVDAARVDFGIFVDKEVSQAGHRRDFIGKVFGYDAIRPKSQNCFSVVFGPSKIIVGNDIMTYVKEALNG